MAGEMKVRLPRAQDKEFRFNNTSVEKLWEILNRASWSADNAQCG